MEGQRHTPAVVRLYILLDFCGQGHMFMDEFVDSFVSQLAGQGAFMSVFIIVKEKVIVYKRTIQIMQHSTRGTEASMLQFCMLLCVYSLCTLTDRL